MRVWVGGGLVVPRPAQAPGVVCLAPRIVGEDGVGSHEQAVALQAHGVWQVGCWRRGIGAVGVVQLDEGVEAVFRVGLAAFAAEDLVRRRSAVGRHGVGPAQIGLVAMRMLGVGARARARVRMQTLVACEGRGRGRAA
jgi:hypothetical protein